MTDWATARYEVLGPVVMNCAHDWHYKSDARAPVWRCCRCGEYQNTDPAMADRYGHGPYA